MRWGAGGARGSPSCCHFASNTEVTESTAMYTTIVSAKMMSIYALGEGEGEG